MRSKVCFLPEPSNVAKRAPPTAGSFSPSGSSYGRQSIGIWREKCIYSSVIGFGWVAAIPSHGGEQLLVGNSGVLSRSGGPYNRRQLQPATSGSAITGGRQPGKGASLHRPPLKQVHQSTRRRSKLGSLLRRSKLKAAVNGGFKSHRAGGNQVRRSQSTGDDDLRLLPDIEDIPSLQRVSDARNMRNKPFPMYDDWLLIFGKDRANGNLAEGSGESVAAIEREEAVELEYYSHVMDFSLGADMAGDMDFSVPHNTPQSAAAAAAPQSAAAPSSSNIVGKKRGRASDGITKGLIQMAQAFGTFFEKNNTTMTEISQRMGYSQDLSNARKQVNEALKSLPLSIEERLKAASMIVDNPQRVDLFFSQDEKIAWVFMLLGGLV
ncbi:hypothetical protein RHGRI_014334 [Rhododendron griersonianum]|uniref:Uncharacterized protein n=1 Tax=Rhododendron griersonianum TaxID=479676 RepID=A0AAV6K999_9ERIC|nr:hypothetical protein RHGRI_014334 [Rhododendron griersonianum]